MRFANQAFSIIRSHKKAFIVLNVLYFGLFAISMIVTAFMPDLQVFINDVSEPSLSEPGITSFFYSGYAEGNVLKAIVLTFAINLIAAVCVITVPSLMIPFLGILVTLVRAVLWGFMFSPIDDERATLIPHSLTILVEGEAYVLAAFAAYIHGRMTVDPGRFGLASRSDGYISGFVATGSLYVLVVFTLAIGAIYEGFEIIYLMPLFR